MGVQKVYRLSLQNGDRQNRRQLRKERGAQPKAIAIEYMTSAEIAAVSKLQNQIGVLLEMGMDYAQVKAMLMNRRLIEKPA